jgi:acetylornithine deacetylase
MKGFLALALAAVPDLVAAKPRKPVHLAFSYDEEIGCLGAPALIEALAGAIPKPSAVIVGEPTNMQVVTGHKGIASYRIRVTGHEAHSSLTHLGVSANMEAIKLLRRLDDLAARLTRLADPASLFTPKETTLTVGILNGGTAGNILARTCEILFDLRTVPGDQPQALLAEVFEAARTLDADLKARFPEAGVEVETCAMVPPLTPSTDDPAEHLARHLTGDNGPARAVSFAAEAGQFQQAGFSTVICGPGSIEQAHQPNEYIELEQMRRGAAFMERLVEALRE